MQLNGGGFAPQHRWDRNAALVFIFLCWLGVLMGFTPAVTVRLQGHADYRAPLILHIHAAAFVGWLVLLTVQIFLVRLRRTSVHKTLGLIGFALIPVMVISALWSEHYSQRYYFDHHITDLPFFIIPITYMIAFGALAGAALALRRDPAAHKRLIVLATAVIVGAAYTRWWGRGLTQAFGDGYFGLILNTYTAANLFYILAIAYDLITRRRVHKVYLIAVPILVASQFVISFIYHSPAWLPVAQAIIGR